MKNLYFAMYKSTPYYYANNHTPQLNPLFYYPFWCTIWSCVIKKYYAALILLLDQVYREHVHL